MTARPDGFVPRSTWLWTCCFAVGVSTAVMTAAAWPVAGSPVAAIYPAGMTVDAAYMAALAVPGWRPMRARAGLFPVVFMAPDKAASSLEVWRFSQAWMVAAADGAYGCTPSARGS